MDKKAMLGMSGPTQCHQCAPRGWRDVPNVTGDYDLDATVMHRGNKDLPHRMELYTKRGGKAYGPGTAYSGYRGYSQDN